MIKKITAALLAVLLLCTSFPLTAAADDSDPLPSDTAVPPMVDGVYEIRTAQELRYVDQKLDGSFRLMNDIDLSGQFWQPIGSRENLSAENFTGVFDGNGYSVTNIRMTITKYGNEDDIQLTSDPSYLGFIARNTGTIRNLSVSGAIYDTLNVQFIGGIAGYNNGVIERCVNHCSITSTTYYSSWMGNIGGIAGSSSEKSSITESYNTGDLIYSSKSSGRRYISGIANGNGMIDNCYNTGTISNKGGTRSTAISSDSNNVDHCYNIGKVTIIDNYGSISLGTAGKNCWTLYDCSDGNSLFPFEMKRHYMFEGFDFENVWMIDSDSEYPYPQLRSNPHVKDAEPDALYQPTYNEEECSYEVRTPEDLFYINVKPDASYTLMNDIDLSEATAKGGEFDCMGNGWMPLAFRNRFHGFTGRFDGNGYTIRGLRIDYQNKLAAFTYIGLFSAVEGTVTDLVLEGSINTRLGDCNIGSITAQLYQKGRIFRCRNACDISATIQNGSVSVGGIACNSEFYYSNVGGTIGYCCNNGNISVDLEEMEEFTKTRVIRLSGISCSSTINDCYNTGDISIKGFDEDTDEAFTAGISTASDKSIQHCYNIGKAEKPISYASKDRQRNCYYLKGCSESDDESVELSDEQFRDLSNFKAFNTEFNVKWTIASESDYPYPQLLDCMQSRPDLGLVTFEVISPSTELPLDEEDTNYFNIMIRVLPLNVIDASHLTWTVSDPSICKITYEPYLDSTNGIIQIDILPLSLGTATITLTHPGDISYSFEVTVIQAIKELDVESVAVGMLVGESAVLPVRTVPEAGPGVERCLYRDYDSNIIEVDNNGVVTAKAVGSTRICVSNFHGTLTAILSVEVSDPNLIGVFTIDQLQNGNALFVGEEMEFFPANAATPTWKYISVYPYTITSSDPSVLLVETTEDPTYFIKKRTLKAVGAGTAVLTFEALSGFRFSKEFEVTDDPDRLDISIQDGNLSYCAEPIEPEVSVMLNGRDIPHSVEYSDNLHAGTASCHIKFSNADAEVTRTFEIAQASDSKLNIELQPGYDYTFSEETPITVYLYIGPGVRKELTEGVDYTKKRSENEATVLVTMSKDFKSYDQNTYHFKSLPQSRITEDMVSFSSPDLQYDEDEGIYYWNYDPTGKPDISFEVVFNGHILEEDKDYEVEYDPYYFDNDYAFETVYYRVNGTGRFTGRVYVSYRIRPASLDDADIDVVPSVVYNKTIQKPSVTLTYKGVKLLEDRDYTVSSKNFVNVGSVPFTIEGKGNYNGSISSSFLILPKPAAELTIRRAEETYRYDGTEKRPSVTVFDGEDELIEGMDYEVSYADNVNAGTGSVIIKGLRNYGGTAAAEFPIEPLELSRCTVSLPDKAFYADGTEQKPKVTVKDGEKLLKEMVDYTLSYSDNINEGTATVTVTGTGNYGGSLSRGFTILPKPKTELSTCTFTLDNYIFKYDGTEKRPAVSGRDGVRLLRENEDYTLSYSDNREIGTASVQLKGVGSYTGTLTVPFIIREDGGEFVWDRDNWSFPNTAPTYFSRLSYADQMSEEYRRELKNNLTNSEYQIVFNSEWFGNVWIDQPWEGACYGMSVTTLLAKEGYIPYESYGENVQSLHELSAPVQNTAVSSLINYYQMLQVKSVIQQKYRTVPNRTNEENIRELISLLEDHHGVLVGFKKNGWGSHTVLAIGYESGSFTRDGVTYQGCIRVCDPNRADRYDENYNIYFNAETYNWCIPAYAGMRSSEGARFNYIGADINEINMGGCLSGTTGTEIEHYIARIDAMSIGSNRSVAKVAEKDGSYMTQNHAPGDIVEDIEYVSGGESKGTTGYNLLDGDSAYRITQSTAQEMKLSMDYENCYMTAGSAAGKSVIFDKAGSVSIESEASDYSISMSFNEGYATDWFAIKVTGSGASSVSLKSSGDGYVLSADALNGVEINANNRTASASATFSVDAESVYIYEIDERTIGVRVDADHNGTYETELPADINTHTVKIGDVNNDGNINISDATYIQMGIAEVITFTDEQRRAADTNGDGKIDISDATCVQMYIADLIKQLG